jgi:magnesium transporter
MKINKTQFPNFEWIDVVASVGDRLDDLATEHGLNPILLADSVQLGHLPKLESSGEFHFLILRAYTAEAGKRVTSIPDLSNKIAFFYNENKIITIHRAEFVFLDAARKGQSSVDRLLLDIVGELVGTYDLPSLWLSRRMDALERIIFLKDSKNISIEELYYLKSQVRVIKKLLILSQSTILQIHVDEENLNELHDIKDRLVQLILTFDEILEGAHHLMNTYLSIAAQKNNDVMKLLTIFSAFFLPLTFIVGVYGMNFENLPELKWENGYYWIWGLMITISIGIFYWFKRKRII